MNKEGMYMLYNDDCLNVLRSMESNSVDSIVTDPPAGISFMNKEWDKDKGGKNEWIKWMEEVAKECLRVIKPGGHALVWSIPRTSHWTGMAWEDAGWQPRDKIYFLFGTGFPKSTNISKMIDKAAGAERELVRVESTPFKIKNDHAFDSTRQAWIDENGYRTKHITAPATEEAKQWNGWGTALKPAAEEWWLLRKPLSEKTIAENVLKWGTGGLNIDGCRVETDWDTDPTRRGWQGGGTKFRYDQIHREVDGDKASPNAAGRWPANLTHDGSDEVVEMFPQTSSGAASIRPRKGSKGYSGGLDQDDAGIQICFGDSGSAARFFYSAKVSKTDRNEDLSDAPDSILARSCQAIAEAKRGNTVESSSEGFNKARIVKNNHPTVKPTNLMRYLCRLITPPSGIILDPFMGSGSTGKAAILEGFKFIGIEKEVEYFEIARMRIKAVENKILNKNDISIFFEK